MGLDFKRLPTSFALLAIAIITPESFNLPVSSRIPLSKILSRARKSRIESRNFSANRRDFTLLSQAHDKHYHRRLRADCSNHRTSLQVVERCSPSPAGRLLEISL